MKARRRVGKANLRPAQFDSLLLWCVLSLLCLGAVMVTSASIATAERLQVPLTHFATHQFAYVGLGLGLMVAASCIPIATIEHYSPSVLVVSLACLILVLIPGFSRPINGSLRWIFLGPISFQPSEMAKLAMIIYMAGYMVRRNRQLKTSLKGFLIPMGVLALVGVLLLMEPDFGALVVIVATILGMLFLGGVRVVHFLVLLPLALSTLIYFALSSSYRVQRLIAFRDPWADQYDTGYQLVQSLIAFGHGAWLGRGLGGSVQKLLYLPEAHSDFIFAVIAEELGLVGALAVLCVYALLIIRAMDIGNTAQRLGRAYAGNLAFGVGLITCFQMIINVCVNIGILPTKGLTLPLVSAGGSSLLVICTALGLLFRVDYENKQALVSAR